VFFKRKFWLPGRDDQAIRKDKRESHASECGTHEGGKGGKEKRGWAYLRACLGKGHEGSGGGGETRGAPLWSRKRREKSASQGGRGFIRQRHSRHLKPKGKKRLQGLEGEKRKRLILSLERDRRGNHPHSPTMEKVRGRGKKGRGNLVLSRDLGEKGQFFPPPGKRKGANTFPEGGKRKTLPILNPRVGLGSESAKGKRRKLSDGKGEKRKGAYCLLPGGGGCKRW